MDELVLTEHGQQRVRDNAWALLTGRGFTGFRESDESYSRWSREFSYSSFSYSVWSCSLASFSSISCAFPSASCDMPSYGVSGISESSSESSLSESSESSVSLSSCSSLAGPNYSVWKWCPCTEDGSFSGCVEPFSSAESGSCPWEPVPKWAKTIGGWHYVEGNENLGPPPVDGDFFGEGRVMTRCPQPEPFAFAQKQTVNLGAIYYTDDPQMMPEWQPAWERRPAPLRAPNPIPFAQASNGEDIFVAAYVWCPTEGCPDYATRDGSDCPGSVQWDEKVEGQWVFHDGDSTIGPPPVSGQYHGETVYIGRCDPCSSSLLSSSLLSSSSISSSSSLFSSSSLLSSSSIESSSEPSESSESFPSLSCPLLPPDPIKECPIFAESCDYSAWSAGLVSVSEVSSSSLSISSEIVTPLFMPCTPWIWCPCCDDDNKVGWQPLMEDSNTSWGPPERSGRFLGEILFMCDCPICSSSSSSSSSSAGAVIACDFLCWANDGEEPTLDGVPVNALGNYVESGTANGKPRYTNGEFWIVWSDYDAQWVIDASGAGTLGMWGGAEIGDSPLGSDPTAYYPFTHPANPGGIIQMSSCASGILVGSAGDMLVVTSRSADPNPAGPFVAVGWHDGQLYYQNLMNPRWFLVFYNSDTPEWSLQQLTPEVFPGDVWPAPNRWSSPSSPGTVAGPTEHAYHPRGIMRGGVTIK